MNRLYLVFAVMFVLWSPHGLAASLTPTSNSFSSVAMVAQPDTAKQSAQGTEKAEALFESSSGQVDSIEPPRPMIPGFLQSPYGPPSFGAPYGTTHALGDWWGAQPWLQKHGLYVAIDDYESLSGNPIGGKRQSETDTGQTAVTLDVDFQRLLEMGTWSKNFWLHMLVLNGHGRNLSQIFGDNGNQVQQIYGARGNVVAHLVWAYFEKSWLQNRIDWSVGWIPTGTFFNNSPWVCSFMNVWMCGNITPTKYLTGGRDWPSGNIGTVLRLMPTSHFYIMGGLFAVSPHSYNGGISGWAWGQDGLGKLSTEAELGWIPEFGKDHLIGHYKVGAMYDNSKYDDLYDDRYGHAWIVSGLAPRKQSGQISAWVLADQMLLRHGEGATNGLILAGAYSYAQGQTSAMNHHLIAALMDTGHMWGRSLDSIGIAFQWANFSRSATLAQEAALTAGQPFQSSNFGTPYGIQGHENIYEFFYTYHVMTGMTLQPDFQYINHIGGTTVFKDAVVFSLAFNVSL